MSIRKHFNEWISRNFKGLSAHTLRQFLMMEDCPVFIDADNFVYVTLYHVFQKQSTEEERNMFDAVQNVVLSCEWL